MRSPRLAALAMARFHIVRRVRPRYGRAAGAVEAVTGVLVLAYPASSISFAVSAALFGLFVVLVARALRGGERFPCACFGRHGDAISRTTLLRAGALLTVSLAGAGVALATTGVPTPSTRLDGVLVAALTLCALVLTAELIRQRPFSTILGESSS